jgi:endonuclease YncB( thermonuclease family)
MSLRKPADFDKHPVPYEYAREKGIFRAHCHHVTDGDTIDVFVDLGLAKYAYETIRLAGRDTPEIFHPSSPAEREHGILARNRVEALLLERPCLIKTFRDQETFGRYVADVFYLFTSPQGFTEISLGDTLAREGLLKRESYS